MGYITSKDKLMWLTVAMLLYNAVLITVIGQNEMQQTIDNLATCLDFPKEDQQLCFDWLQALTGTDVAWALGGNASIYAIFRAWSVGQHDNQIKRLMGQTHRLSCEMPNSYVPVIVDDGWVGVLTHRCQELYDDYAAAVAGYNAGSLTAEELQQGAKKLSTELSKTYSALEKPRRTIKNN